MNIITLSCLFFIVLFLHTTTSQIALSPSSVGCAFEVFSINYYNHIPSQKLTSNYMPIYVINNGTNFIDMSVTVQNKTVEFFSSVYNCPEECVVHLAVEHVDKEVTTKVVVNAKEKLLGAKKFTCEFDLILSESHLVPITPEKVVVRNSVHGGMEGNEWFVAGAFQDSRVDLSAERGPSLASIGCEFTARNKIVPGWDTFLKDTQFDRALIGAQMFELRYTNMICDGPTEEYSLSYSGLNFTSKTTFGGCGGEVVDLFLSVEAVNATQNLLNHVCDWGILVNCEPSCGALFAPWFILLVLLGVVAAGIIVLVIFLLRSKTKEGYANL